MNILVVEDIILVAQRIAELINDHLDSPNITLCHTLTDARNRIEESSYDLLLLDLNINGLDGFELLKTASAYSFQTIIVTATAEKAVAAFDYGVLDFVTKPITKRRLNKALDRFLNGRAEQREKLRFLTTKVGQKFKFIPIKDIAYIQGAGNYSEIFTNEGESHLHNKSLDKLIILLPDEFTRIHRSYIAPQSKIKRLVSHGSGKYTAELIGQISIPVSRRVYNTEYKNKP
jgi:DNA-binding LytR/AlgR family response regulator